jgi:hypothetical protein
MRRIRAITILLCWLLLVAIPATGRRKKDPPQPAQEPLVAGCVSAVDIYDVSGGSFLFQGTVLQKDIPHLQATIHNDCEFLVEAFVTIGYYGPDGSQIDTQTETATIAAGTRYSLIHVLSREVLRDV